MLHGQTEEVFREVGCRLPRCPAANRQHLSKQHGQIFDPVLQGGNSDADSAQNLGQFGGEPSHTDKRSQVFSGPCNNGQTTAPPVSQQVEK